MLTVLPVEMTAVLAHISAGKAIRMAGPVLCEVGSFTASGGLSWQVVAAEVGSGTVDTASAVVAVTSEFQPDVLMLVGISGAPRDVLQVGDVVAGTEVAATGSAAQSGGATRRAGRLSLSGAEKDRPRQAGGGSSAAGGCGLCRADRQRQKVVADEEYRAWLRATFSDALAIENEGFALARAAEVYAGGQRYVVRGISDNAGSGKSDDGHVNAADAAAAFAFELLDAYSQTRASAPEMKASRLPDADGPPDDVIGKDRDLTDDTVLMSWAEGRVGHAFISYVREDSPAVDRLQVRLESAGVHVWRDTADLWPGQDWRAAVRRAITGEALVFLACFSRQSLSRPKTYQNEELNLAIEQMSLRRPDTP